MARKPVISGCASGMKTNNVQYIYATSALSLIMLSIMKTPTCIRSKIHIEREETRKRSLKVEQLILLRDYV